MRRFGCSRRSAGLTRGDLGDKKLGHWRDSGARRLPRVGGGGRSHGAGGFGRCWVAYGMGSRVAERRSGTPGLGLEAVLRAGPRGGSGAGVRERLG